MRSITTFPDPRDSRGAKVSHSRRAPVAAAMRPAASRPGPCRAGPRSRIEVFLPERRARATRSTTADDTVAGAGLGSAAAGPSAAFQAVSAGRIRVATWPGGEHAAATARAPSAATVLELTDECTQPET